MFQESSCHEQSQFAILEPLKINIRENKLRKAINILHDYSIKISRTRPVTIATISATMKIFSRKQLKVDGDIVELKPVNREVFLNYQRLIRINELDQQSKGKRLFVTRLKDSVTKEMLLSYFSQFGHIEDCYIRGREGGSIKRIAFISYSHVECLNNALNCRPHILNGDHIAVDRARERSSTPRSLCSIKLRIDNLQNNITTDVLTDYINSLDIHEINIIPISPQSYNIVLQNLKDAEILLNTDHSRVLLEASINWQYRNKKCNTSLTDNEHLYHVKSDDFDQCNSSISRYMNDPNSLPYSTDEYQYPSTSGSDYNAFLEFSNKSNSEYTASGSSEGSNTTAQIHHSFLQQSKDYKMNKFNFLNSQSEYDLGKYDNMNYTNSLQDSSILDPFSFKPNKTDSLHSFINEINNRNDDEVDRIQYSHTDRLELNPYIFTDSSKKLNSNQVSYNTLCNSEFLKSPHVTSNKETEWLSSKKNLFSSDSLEDYKRSPEINATCLMELSHESSTTYPRYFDCYKRIFDRTNEGKLENEQFNIFNYSSINQTKKYNDQNISGKNDNVFHRDSNYNSFYSMPDDIYRDISLAWNNGPNRLISEKETCLKNDNYPTDNYNLWQEEEISPFSSQIMSSFQKQRVSRWQRNKQFSTGSEIPPNLSIYNKNEQRSFRNTQNMIYQDEFKNNKYKRFSDMKSSDILDDSYTPCEKYDWNSPELNITHNYLRYNGLQPNERNSYSNYLTVHSLFTDETKYNEPLKLVQETSNKNSDFYQDYETPLRYNFLANNIPDKKQTYDFDESYNSNTCSKQYEYSPTFKNIEACEYNKSRENVSYSKFDRNIYGTKTQVSEGFFNSDVFPRYGDNPYVTPNNLMYSISEDYKSSITNDSGSKPEVAYYNQYPEYDSSYFNYIQQCELKNEKKADLSDNLESYYNMWIPHNTSPSIESKVSSLFHNDLQDSEYQDTFSNNFRLTNTSMTKVNISPIENNKGNILDARSNISFLDYEKELSRNYIESQNLYMSKETYNSERIEFNKQEKLNKFINNDSDIYNGQSLVKPISSYYDQIISYLETSVPEIYSGENLKFILNSLAVSGDLELLINWYHKLEEEQKLLVDSFVSKIFQQKLDINIINLIQKARGTNCIQSLVNLLSKAFEASLFETTATWITDVVKSDVYVEIVALMKYSKGSQNLLIEASKKDCCTVVTDMLKTLGETACCIISRICAEVDGSAAIKFIRAVHSANASEGLQTVLEFFHTNSAIEFAEILIQLDKRAERGLLALILEVNSPQKAEFLAKSILGGKSSLLSFILKHLPRLELPRILRMRRIAKLPRNSVNGVESNNKVDNNVPESPPPLGLIPTIQVFEVLCRLIDSDITEELVQREMEELTQKNFVLESIVVKQSNKSKSYLWNQKNNRSNASDLTQGTRSDEQKSFKGIYSKNRSNNVNQDRRKKNTKQTDNLGEISNKKVEDIDNNELKCLYNKNSIFKGNTRYTENNGIRRKRTRKPKNYDPSNNAYFNILKTLDNMDATYNNNCTNSVKTKTDETEIQNKISTTKQNANLFSIFNEHNKQLQSKNNEICEANKTQESSEISQTLNNNLNLYWSQNITKSKFEEKDLYKMNQPHSSCMRTSKKKNKQDTSTLCSTDISVSSSGQSKNPSNRKKKISGKLDNNEITDLNSETLSIGIDKINHNFLLKNIQPKINRSHPANSLKSDTEAEFKTSTPLLTFIRKQKNKDEAWINNLISDTSISRSEIPTTTSYCSKISAIPKLCNIPRLNKDQFYNLQSDISTIWSKRNLRDILRLPSIGDQGIKTSIQRGRLSSNSSRCSRVNALDIEEDLYNYLKGSTDKNNETFHISYEPDKCIALIPSLPEDILAVNINDENSNPESEDQLDTNNKIPLLKCPTNDLQMNVSNNENCTLLAANERSDELINIQEYDIDSDITCSNSTKKRKSIKLSNLRPSIDILKEKTLIAKYSNSKKIGIREGCRFITSQNLFEIITYSMIFLNAIYIGIDTDYNKHEDLYSASKIYTITENIFAVFFTVEILLRFLAFNRFIESLYNKWFVFDSALVIIMIAEVWIIPVIIFVTEESSVSNLGSFNQLRVLRLLKLSRIARLMRAIPELMTLFLSILAATRSVMTTMFLLIVIIYIFAIIFTTQLKSLSLPQNANEAMTQRIYLIKDSFGSMLMSMLSLFVRGTLLDDISELIEALQHAPQPAPIFLAILFIFIMLSSFTVLNMLIGVLVEVVTTTNKEQRAKSEIYRMHVVLSEVFGKLDVDGNGLISRSEFSVMQKVKEVREAFSLINVEPMYMKAIEDCIFFVDVIAPGVATRVESRELSFTDFLDMIVHLIPTNPLSVLDVARFRRFLLAHLELIQGYINSILTGSAGYGMAIKKELLKEVQLRRRLLAISSEISASQRAVISSSSDIVSLRLALKSVDEWQRSGGKFGSNYLTDSYTVDKLEKALIQIGQEADLDTNKSKYKSHRRKRKKRDLRDYSSFNETSNNDHPNFTDLQV